MVKRRRSHERIALFLNHYEPLLTSPSRSPGPGEPLVKMDCPLNSSSGCSPSGRRPRALTSALLQRPTSRPLQILQLSDCPRDTLPGRLSLTIVLLGDRKSTRLNSSH